MQGEEPRLWTPAVLGSSPAQLLTSWCSASQKGFQVPASETDDRPHLAGVGGCRHTCGFSLGYLKAVGLALSPVAWGTPLPSLGRSGKGLASAPTPQLARLCVSVTQQEHEGFSTRDSARRRFLRFQAAFRQVIRAGCWGPA